jgi:hypothetical protein
LLRLLLLLLLLLRLLLRLLVMSAVWLPPARAEEDDANADSNELKEQRLWMGA